MKLLMSALTGIALLGSHTGVVEKYYPAPHIDIQQVDDREALTALAASIQGAHRRTNGKSSQDNLEVTLQAECINSKRYFMLNGDGGSQLLSFGHMERIAGVRYKSAARETPLLLLQYHNSSDTKEIYQFVVKESEKIGLQKVTDLVAKLQQRDNSGVPCTKEPEPLDSFPPRAPLEHDEPVAEYREGKACFSQLVLTTLKQKLPSIGEQGTFHGYNVHRIGSVTFPDCKFNKGDGLDAISRKLQSYDLRDKIIVLYGSTDTRSAKNCPSVTNDYLSGHRAVSTLNDLEAKMGDHLHAAHVDIIAGGNTLNRRAVDIYLLDKRKMEITDPF